MIQLKNLELRIGTKTLLNDANLTLHEGKKIALVGANGAGKTTFFRLLQGKIRHDHGDVVLPTHFNWVELAQEMPNSSLSTIEYVLLGDKELQSTRKELARAEEQDDGIAMGHCYETMNAIGAYDAESRAAKILIGLGFQQEQLSNPTTSFSGGWRMRLNLAQVLISRASVLLLDEPTNHLDLEAIIWLEDWITSCQATVLIISHDREFLDHCVNQTVHLRDKQLFLYGGNYSTFEKEYALQLQVQQATFDKQQKVRSHLQSYVDRFRYKASKAKQAQSRIKQLERMELVSAVLAKTPFSFRFKPADSVGNPIVSLKKVSIGYEKDKPIVKNMGFSLSDGDRIGLIGPNGAGKSTVIKLLAGQLDPLSGEEILNPKTQIGYFAQHQLDTLDMNVDAMTHLKRIAPKIMESEARKYLGGFNFQGDRVFESVGQFSGGEKARLALALLIWKKPNLLLLDEPTNHLDMETREALVLALQSFNGALVLVSHDRYLLKTVIDEFYLVDQGSLSKFNGNIEDYRALIMGSDFGQAHLSKAGSPKSSSAKSTASKKSKPVNVQKSEPVAAPILSERDKRIKRSEINKDMTKQEKRLAKCQDALAEVSKALEDADLYTNDPDKFHALVVEQKTLREKGEGIEEAVLELLESLERLN